MSFGHLHWLMRSVVAYCLQGGVYSRTAHLYDGPILLSWFVDVCFNLHSQAFRIESTNEHAAEAHALPVRTLTVGSRCLPCVSCHACITSTQEEEWLRLLGLVLAVTCCCMHVSFKTAPSGVRICTTCAGLPLLFMTNHGADPSQELQQFAIDIVGAEAYHQLAMGQGQTQPALDLLHSCARSGMLVCCLHERCNICLNHAWHLLLCLSLGCCGSTQKPLVTMRQTLL